MIQAILILVLGTLIQSSSYVPLRRIRGWHWETYWLVQACFAWLLFPLAGALLYSGSLSDLIDLYISHSHISLYCVGFGFLWGIGGLTFGLAIRYLGISLGQTAAIGICGAFGSILGPLISGHAEMLTVPVILGVVSMLFGVFVVMLAAVKRRRMIGANQAGGHIKEFDLKKGIVVLLLSGVMSSFFNVGLSLGQDMMPSGTSDMYAGLPPTLLITLGGFIFNVLYCFVSRLKHNTVVEYTDKTAWGRNLFFCVITGLFWYSQFFSLSIVRGMMSEHQIFIAYNWCILMTLNILFTNLWGMILKEWKGAGSKAVITLCSGLVILIASIFLPVIVPSISQCEDSGLKSTYVVSADGDGDFKSLADALNSIDEGETEVMILVKKGKYRSDPYLGNGTTDKCSRRNISIIGENRDSCVIFNDVGYYRWQDKIDYSSLRISGNVRLSNLSFYSTSERYASEYEKNGWSSSSNHRAYCLHIDNAVCPGDRFVIDNCNFFNDHFACIGFGLRENFTLEIRNCRLESTFSDDSDGYSFGTLFGHSAMDKPHKGQKLIVRNSVLINRNQPHTVSLKEVVGNKNEVMLVGNTYISTNPDSAIVYTSDFVVTNIN